MPKIVYSKAASRDLHQIQEYITNKWGRDTSKKMIKTLISAINELEQFPVRGVSLGKLIDFPTDYRYLFLEKNYVFYYLEDDIIYIVRIANERQDFMHLLFEL